MAVEIVSVVAGGWSVKECNLNAIPGKIIAVNDSALHLPKLDVILTMDRKWTTNRWDWLNEQRLPFYTREKNLTKEQRKLGWVHPYVGDETQTTFGEDENDLRGPNSGHCGLNLAYVWRPECVYLFGFDMRPGPKGEHHWYPDYPWRPKGQGQAGKKTLRDWAKDMEAAALCFATAGIRVYNVSERSAIRAFPRISPADIQIRKNGRMD